MGENHAFRTLQNSFLWGKGYGIIQWNYIIVTIYLQNDQVFNSNAAMAPIRNVILRIPLLSFITFRTKMPPCTP